ASGQARHHPAGEVLAAWADPGLHEGRLGEADGADDCGVCQEAGADDPAVLAGLLRAPALPKPAPGCAAVPGHRSLGFGAAPVPRQTASGAAVAGHLPKLPRPVTLRCPPARGSRGA
ncbi:unnamed protein product, partial [Effrenium voratum]